VVRIKKTLASGISDPDFNFEIGYMDSLRYEVEVDVKKVIKKYLLNETSKY
jgi:hypothetical protein